MEIKLDVLISTCIKQSKPWPRISWIGQEKEAIFLLDDKRINEINLASGRTKKKIPRLHSLLKNVVILTTSRNGAWLVGILTTGELFLWNKDQDFLKIVPAVEESRKVVTAAQECLMRLYLYISGDGRKVLFTTPTACVFLWESTEHENTYYSKNSSVTGRWTQILPDQSIMLPSTNEKETGVHAAFIQNEILGDCCLCTFVFYSGECLVFTFLALRWHENSFRCVSSLPYQIHWVQQTCSLANLVPQCLSVKSRGALLTAFAGDGLLLAVAINQNNPQATQILFLNTLNFVTVSGNLKGCSSKNGMVPSKFIRSYWVGDMSWTPDSLFLACMLKRGSLILLTCMGELLTLITSGCSVEFGPAEFIPFHPLITYRQQHSLCQDSCQSLGSSASESDLLRQRFSVASHSRLPYLIVSDGYMITVLRFPNNLSPSGFVRSLLLDSTQRLENIRQNFMNCKSKGRRLCLRSLLSLKASLLKHTQNQSSIFPTIPKFLEEDITEMSEKTMDLQDYEEESDGEKQFQNSSSSFSSQRISSFVGKADQGCLEFASMFDTIHAKDVTEEKDNLSMEVNSIQKNLLTAWQIGISKNMKEKDTLLSYTVNCFTHFFNILQFIKCSSLNQDAFLNKSVKNTHWMHYVLKYFQQCLTLLYGHSRASLTGHVAKLTLQTIKLILIQQQDQPFSENLLACFCLLRMASRSLSSVCIPQYENFFASPDVHSLVELDSLVVPIFLVLDESGTQQFSSLKSLLREPPQAINHDEKTEKRLTVLWQLLYKKVVWYQTQLNRRTRKNADEESVVSSLLSHVQAILQSSGVTLEQHLKLNSVAGEEKFLLGSYRESVDAWRRSLCEIKANGGKRTCFLQSRYYLAILFCHLYHYNLCEAQGLCDHLVGEILRRSQLSVRQMEIFSDTKYSQHELWKVTEVHTEAALAVIQSMARFMAAYFTNQLLYILPPHNVDILHPLHIKLDVSPRIIPLQHSLVTRAVRDQNLSSVWTAEYALDLFFVGGLVPEAVWLTHRLGDWKLSVSIGVAYDLYCQSSNQFSRLKKTEYHLPLSLSPTQTFQEKLQSLLGQPVISETANERSIKYKQFTDPIEEEDSNVLYSSVQELLKAAVMADADILSEMFQLLMDSGKDLGRKLCGLVPDGLYLPAPPLYCPQPASLSEEDCNDILLKIERESRQKVSGVLQRIILLFRAARCSFPAAQWYITQLKRARKVMQKIRMKGSLPSLSPFPESLFRYCNFPTVFNRPTSSGDHQFDDVSCKILGCFRELCALCWMFHVRERLSDNCRRYQTARENMNNYMGLKENEYDASTVEHCLNAVEWACRMLPFCRFMNVEELVQDVILSLLGELPPIKKVAEILVKAFPNSEDVRVPLRDKYHTLQQQLRHCIVKGPSSEEMMPCVIHTAEKVRVKALKRVIRNIGPIEINIWEPAEEGAANDEAHCYDRFSLGTSLSRSTLTDFGNPQVYSDAETVDTLSDPLLTEEARDQTPSPQRDNEPKTGEIGSKNTTCKIRTLNWKTKYKEKVHRKNLHNQCNLPIVGAWEFERDDDEYVIFLELFLSYVLERDLINCSDPGIPFLTSFSGLLRDHELNSLFFDVHTTLKRRQGKTRSQRVFRAGSCYTVTLASCNSETVSVHNEKQNVLENQVSVSIVQSTESMEPSEHNLMKGLDRGLFGLKHKSIYSTQVDSQGVTFALASQAFPNLTFCSSQTPVTSKYIYKITDIVDIVPGDELARELIDKFNNIAKLLEWMIRWSDKRLLCGSNVQDSLEEKLPMIHVKTSAAAVLTSLWLLEQLYNDGLQARNIKFKHPGNQDLKEFASLSEAQPKIEKKSSIDESSFVLADPPLNVQSVKAYDDLSESGFRMSTKSNYFKKEINHENYSVPHMIEDLNEEGPFLQEELDAKSESKEFFEEPFETPKSSTSSVRIKPVEHERGKPVPISDVKCPQEDQRVEKSEKRKAEQNGVTETVTGIIPHSLCLENDVEVLSNRETSVSDGQPSLTVASNMSCVASDASLCTKKQVNKQVSTEEKQSTSETVRQMLQDEMFKLVQLQQINFMSLMQIVQSSFANLPNVQQILQQSQSVPLERSQPSHMAKGGDCEKASCSANTSPKTELLTQEDKEKSDKISTFEPRSSLRDESNNGHTENHPDANISLNLLENHSSETGFIPPSQNLPSSAPTKPLHLLAPSSNVQKIPKLISTEKKQNYSNGFSLLKLESDYHFKPPYLHPIEISSAFGKPPQVPQVAWSSLDSLWNLQSSYTPRKQSKSTAHLNASKYDLKILRQTYEEEKRWAEIVHKGCHRHLNLDQYEGQQEVSSQQQFSENVNMDKTLITEKLAGIPLLHLQLNPVPKLLPIVRQPITTTLIPVKPTTKETDFRETVQHTGISLLHADLPQKEKVPALIPLQNLIAFEQRHQHPTVPSASIGQEQAEPIQLLKTDIEPFEASNTQNRKRQKWRDEKQMKEEEEKKKPSVTFRPDDSIVSISDTEMVDTSEMRDQQAKSASYLGGDFFISLDTVGEAIATSTDLHYMASTRKKPSETQDASTNTDPVLKSYQDVGTDAENVVSEVGKNQSFVSVPVPESLSVPEMLPQDIYLNLPPEENETHLLLSLSDASEMSGHEYINVTDIEQSDLKVLHIIPESAEERVTTQQNEEFEILSSPKLRHIADSVTRTPPEEFKKKDNHLKNLSIQMQKEDKKSDSARDDVTWNIVFEDARTFHSSRLPVKIIGKENFSKKLQEMDRQLQTLQNIAENMEKDFSNTKQLVKIIEEFETTASADLGAHPSFSENAGLIGDEHYLKGLNFEDVGEEKEGLKLEDPVVSYTTLQVPSSVSAPSASNFPSGITSSYTDFHVCGELTHRSLEDPLQITGLSGVTDIINDLIVEGDVCPTELGFTKTQAEKIYRSHDSAAGHHQKTEKEKKEIRVWMKRKQKERLKEFLKKLDEQRQKEHNPFKIRKNVHSREIKLIQKKKEEKDRALLSEHHSMRVSQALSLMNEMLSEIAVLPENEHRPLSKTRSPQEYRKQRIASPNRRHPNSCILSERSRIAAKPSFGQTRPCFIPAGSAQSRGNTAMLLQKSTSRGGMKHAANCPNNSRYSAECRASRTPKQKLPPVATAVQTEELDRETERDVVSPWSVPDDIQRILRDTHDSLIQVSPLRAVSFSPLGVNDTDGVSESTGSILSKLDWNAIEAMVADVEDK
ncbi:ciliogenesis and planar polarity effector 1 [Rhea pennata]|uniref:ciliogenesis and planar polarity effector 1 n=1 Tax=Rhea pennata TaxID=8795 RepID=UPI002E2571D3